MEKSEKIINISKALLKFDAEMGTVKMGEVNPFFHNKYASLSDILEAIKEPLQKSGLTIKQFPEGDNMLTTLLIHAESGEYLSSTYSMKAVKDDPQQQGSRITYQRRYSIGAVLGLNIDKDDDGNDASKKDDKQKEKVKEPVKKNPMGEKPFLQAIEKIVKGQPITLEALKGLYELTPDQEKKITETIAKYKKEEK